MNDDGKISRQREFTPFKRILVLACHHMALADKCRKKFFYHPDTKILTFTKEDQFMQ